MIGRLSALMVRCMSASWFGRSSRGMVLLGVVIAVSLLFRVVGLNHLPGINGDEGYLGVKIVLFLRGEPISMKTGTDLYGDPISFVISGALHSLFGVSFWTLRLTTVITGTLNVILLYWCLRRLLGGAVASVTAAITACMPLALAYSRFFWERSQSLLVLSSWL
ncbi:MAG: glycosyltransferase family 39 protein, partial [Myxococcales bacterium]